MRNVLCITLLLFHRKWTESREDESGGGEGEDESHCLSLLSLFRCFVLATVFDMSSGTTPRFREYKLKSTVHPIQHNVMIMPEKGFSFHGLVPPVKLARHKIDYHALPGSAPSHLSSSLPAINLLSVSDNSHQKTHTKSLVSSPTAPGPKVDAHGDVVSIAPYGGGSANQARKPFKKKTQVFMHEFTKEDDEARKLRIEESKPWVLEDHDNRAWQGRLEGGQQQKYVLFVNQVSRSSHHEQDDFEHRFRAMSFV